MRCYTQMNTMLCSLLGSLVTVVAFLAQPASMLRLPSVVVGSESTTSYIEQDAMVQMRDNISLYTRVFFPSPQTPTTAPTTGHLHEQTSMSALYIQCPYDTSFHQAFLAQWMEMVDFEIPIWGNLSFPVGLRMALVIQETRGRYNSTGSFDSFNKSVQDTDDSTDWIRSQSWSNRLVTLH